MLDLAFSDRVVMRRPGARSAANEVTYEVVREDDGTESTLRCLIDRRIHRRDSREVKEITADATVVYRSDRGQGPNIALGWILLDGRGVAYEVGDISEAFQMGAWYRRAELKLTRAPAPVEGN